MNIIESLSTPPHSAGYVWNRVLEDVLDHGVICSPRGKRVKELIGYQSVIDMSRPVVNVTARKLGRRFMCAEAAWILSGDNRVATIKNYSPTIDSFSDDGVYYRGAYGPKIVDQITYAVDKLLEDPDTRQSVINIWRENPRESKDVPCTISVQFLIRGDRLHVIDTMRSSDAWLGVVYDWFNFSMLAGYVLLLLRERRDEARGSLSTSLMFERLSLGSLYLNAGSEHLYETNWEAARTIVQDDPRDRWPYEPFDPLGQFVSPGHLIEHLWRLANKDESLDGWLASQIVGRK
jgi:thymidylate synthase